jgi:hypothetical protein
MVNGFNKLDKNDGVVDSIDFNRSKQMDESELYSNSYNFSS